MRQPTAWQDHATRALFIACGVVAAVIFVLKGNGEALPALALGGTLGACLVRGAEPEG